MRIRLLRLRLRRGWRQGQKQVENLSQEAEQQIEQHLFKRFGRLLPIRRFVFGWVGLLVLLTGGVVATTATVSVAMIAGCDDDTSSGFYPDIGVASPRDLSVPNDLSAPNDLTSHD